MYWLSPSQYVFCIFEKAFMKQITECFFIFSILKIILEECTNPEKKWLSHLSIYTKRY